MNYLKVLSIVSVAIFISSNYTLAQNATNQTGSIDSQLSGGKVTEVVTNSKEIKFQTSNIVDKAVIEDARNKATHTLQEYTIGNRAQRVRFFTSNTANSTNFVGNGYNTKSPATTILAKDPLNSDGYITCGYGKECTSGSRAGLAKFTQSDWNGMIINPRFMICAVDLLRLIEKVGNNNPEVFKHWLIDEINIFITPVATISPEDYKLQISPVAQIPKDPALNIQIPFVVSTSHCALPSAETLQEALLAAAGN